MIRITVIAVGRLQEDYWKKAAAEYEKRLQAYCKLRVVEVPDERAPERASAAEREAILQKEGGRVLRAADSSAPLWALAIDGERMSSERFSGAIGDFAVHGGSHIQFVIGGSLGLSPEVLSGAARRISFSDMTFPHQLMRVILLEQIYRGFRIVRGEPYHK